MKKFLIATFPDYQMGVEEAFLELERHGYNPSEISLITLKSKIHSRQNSTDQLSFSLKLPNSLHTDETLFLDDLLVSGPVSHLIDLIYGSKIFTEKDELVNPKKTINDLFLSLGLSDESSLFYVNILLSGGVVLITHRLKNSLDVQKKLNSYKSQRISGCHR